MKKAECHVYTVLKTHGVYWRVYLNVRLGLWFF